MKKFLSGMIPILYCTIACISFIGCEFNEPFPDPSADFEIWGINPVTNAYEQVLEPYDLTVSVSYDYIVEGTGQQFVFWFGVTGDPERDAPTGSNFEDRGLNHVSSGDVAVDMKVRYSYTAVGTYDIVLVASSYNYSDDEYKESLTRRTVNVIAAP